jgi:hypothetical protein
MINIDGYCPLGCGQTLRAEETKLVNRVICWAATCPDPLAAQKILQDPMTEHIVRFSFSGSGFTVKHPLRERLDDALLYCELAQICGAMPEPPGGVAGSYLVRLEEENWTFERIDAA